jgi:hypothetical protein
VPPARRRLSHLAVPARKGAIGKESDERKTTADQVGRAGQPRANLYVLVVHFCLRDVGMMNPFTGRPEWEPEPGVIAEIERSTQEAEKRDSRNPIVRFCGLCFILGLLGVGVSSLSSPPVANSRHAQPVVSRPVRAHQSTHHPRRVHSSGVSVLANRQTTASVPTE